MLRGLLALSILVAPAVWGQTADAPADVLAKCVDSDADAYGLEQLEAHCPGIEHALVELGYSPYLSERQLETLNSYSLRDLQQLSDRYAASTESGSPATESVAAIIESMRTEQGAERPPTLLERIKRWIRETFLGRENARNSWLSEWLQKLDVPDTATRWIIYGLIALVLVLALLVLINELRAAGVFRRDGTVRKGSAIAAEAARAVRDLTMADLDSLPPADRPSALLRILVRTLVQGGRLRAQRSLTHRELVSRVHLDSEAQRESFQRVSKLGERSLYGNDQVDAAEIDGVVQAGRELVAQIVAAPTGSTAGSAPR